MTFLASSLVILAAGAAMSVPLDANDLDALVAHALRENPALEAMAAEQRGALARERAAGSLPDPVLRWGEMVESVETRTGPQQRILSLQQSLPWPGTLGARRESATARSQAAAAVERGTQVQVAASVRRAWAQAAWLAEMQELARRQVGLVESLEGSLRAAYEAGEGSYADLLQVQLEVARLQDRHRGLLDQTPAAVAGLNAALGRDPEAPLELPAGLRALPGDATAASGPHPQLAALAHRRQAAELDARAAARAGLPQLTLGVDWIQIGEAAMAEVEGSGKDAWVARVGLSLPIWRGKHDGSRLAAEAQGSALAAEREARRQQLAARLTRARVAWQDAVRRHRLHRDDLLPRARQAYEAAVAAYRAGGESLADLLAAERTLITLEESSVAARRDAWLAAAEHDEAAGQVPTGLPGRSGRLPLDAEPGAM